MSKYEALAAKTRETDQAGARPACGTADHAQARVRTRAGARIDDLERIAARIEATGRDDLGDLAFDLLGRQPDFAAGAYRVQIHGVGGSSTESSASALRAWARAARRRIALNREG